MPIGIIMALEQGVNRCRTSEEEAEWDRWREEEVRD